MYEPYDQILNNKDNLDKWIEKENKMLNPFGFNIEKV